MPATQNTIFAKFTALSDCRCNISGDGFAVEVAKSREEQQGVEKYQANDYREQREMRKLGNHRGAKAFAGVHERIYEHGFLQEGKFLERAPGIVGAAEENHGRDDE